MQKLVLIDGNAIVHRAFHALPPLTNDKGILTNAVYGFFSMTLKIIQDLSPDFLIVCFDRAAPTFRKQMYAGYQAKRPEMSDELGPQFAIIQDILRKTKVQIEELDGFEADDLIGTFSTQAKKKDDMQVIILSGDRDLLQLVDKNVLMLAPVVGVTQMILYNEEKIKEKYDLNPSQVVDYKALVGDASDNYPGVSGVGPKTAAELINKFGSLEGIYQNLGEVNPKIMERLAVDAEQAALAKKLATIELNVPLKIDWEKSDISKMNTKAMFLAFNDYGFRSLVVRFGSFDKAQALKNANRVSVKPPEVKNKDEEQLGLI